MKYDFFRLLFSVGYALMMIGKGFGQEAYDIVKKADTRMRGKTLQAELVIRTIRPSWTREIKLKAWSKGTDYSMILIQDPKKDKGIAFLKRKKEVWNWMPVLERTIKLPPSMMAQSWMGTDFSNDDLVRESSVLTDYTHKTIGDTLIGNRVCYLIELLPKPESAVIWGKLILCIDKKDFLELHTRFYDEEGVLISVMNAYDVMLMDNRLIPTRIEMIPADKKKQRTEMIYKSVLFDRPIEDVFFIIDNMKNLQ
jgi:hypothetical protein